MSPALTPGLDFGQIGPGAKALAFPVSTRARNRPSALDEIQRRHGARDHAGGNRVQYFGLVEGQDRDAALSGHGNTVEVLPMRRA